MIRVRLTRASKRPNEWWIDVQAHDGQWHVQNAYTPATWAQARQARTFWLAENKEAR